MRPSAPFAECGRADETPPLRPSRWPCRLAPPRRTQHRDGLAPPRRTASSGALSAACATGRWFQSLLVSVSFHGPARRTASSACRQPALRFTRGAWPGHGAPALRGSRVSSPSESSQPAVDDAAAAAAVTDVSGRSVSLSLPLSLSSLVLAATQPHAHTPRTRTPLARRAATSWPAVRGSISSMLCVCVCVCACVRACARASLVPG